MLLPSGTEDFKRVIDQQLEFEVFFQGLLLGFVASLHDKKTYVVQSNRESGLGRFDIALIPADRTRLGIIIELKAVKEKGHLQKAAQEALNQIVQKEYLQNLKQAGVTKTMAIGIGFCGKEIQIVGERVTCC